MKRISMRRAGRDRSFAKALTAVGLRLAALRIEKGFKTLKEFTDHYDLPEIQYWRIEKGKANLTLKSLSRILAIHSISIHEFFCIIEETS